MRGRELVGSLRDKWDTMRYNGIQSDTLRYKNSFQMLSTVLRCFQMLAHASRCILNLLWVAIVRFPSVSELAFD